MSSALFRGNSLRMVGTSLRVTHVRTATPSIGTIVCINDTGLGYAYIDFDVTNNDAGSATVEVSTSSTFAFIDDSQVVAGGSSGTFIIGPVTNPPGSTTVYARARASNGNPVSTTASRTQNIPGCLVV